MNDINEKLVENLKRENEQLRKENKHLKIVNKTLEEVIQNDKDISPFDITFTFTKDVIGKLYDTTVHFWDIF